MLAEFHFRASLSGILRPVSCLEQRMDVHRALVFSVRWDAPPLDWLLSEFRVLVNESIRIALHQDIRSRARLVRAAYRDLSPRHAVYKQYIPSAFEVAVGVPKDHRRRLKRKKRSSVPYIRKLMLKAENQSYQLDRQTGRLRIPIRGTEGVQIRFRRRRRLATKRAGDRRVMRRLLNREGCRERNRVLHRLHLVSKRLVQFAKNGRAAIVLEDLTLRGAGRRSRRMNRRLSSWPRGEIHRQIEYKAALAGVPIVKVNPAWTSKTCPVCGARRRDRVGKDFVCLMCDWEMDRQINAGLNILKTALASNEALARAVRFQPGALRDDVVIPLYDLPGFLAGAREEPSGVE